MAIENRASDVVSVVIAMTVLISVIVPLRFWVRGKVVGKLGADDWCIGVATVLSIVMNVFILLSTEHGAGKHTKDIAPAILETGLKENFITQVLTVPCIAMVKISIALFLLRLAATQMFRLICISFVVFMGLYSFASTFTVIFQCSPVRYAWDMSVGGTCLPIPARLGLIYSYSIVTIISDFFLVLLPIVMLWHVKIPRRQRVVIRGILGVGAFAASASIVKTLFISNYGKAGDFLWDSVDICIWTVIEVGLGIIGASIPALKPLFKAALERTGCGSSGSGSRACAYALSAAKNPTGVSTEIRTRTGAGAEAENMTKEETMGISKSTQVRVHVDVEASQSCEER